MSKTKAQRTFYWSGCDLSGQEQSGELQANDLPSARLELQAQGLYKLRIRRGSLKPTENELSRSSRGGRIRSKDLMLLTRQLATMTQAGIGVIHAFEIAARSARTPKARDLINDLHELIENGSPLHQAFAQYPKYFDALYCATIASGEASGSLDEVLKSLAHHLQKAQNLRAKIRSALMYPLVVTLVTIAAVSIIMIFMVPAFAAQFASFGAPLPAATLIVIEISRTLSEYGIFMLAAMIGLIYGMLRIWQGDREGRARMDHCALRLPILGVLLRKAAIARWSRTLSTLAHAGVPLIEALQVVGRAAGNAVYLQASESMVTAIHDGRSLSSAMSETHTFPDTIVHMCALGEEAGALDDMLGKSAAMLEQEVDEAVSGLSSILEPIMIIVLGVVIGGILLAMYMPIFQLGRVI